jgi:hypothetical protein
MPRHDEGLEPAARWQPDDRIGRRPMLMPPPERVPPPPPEPSGLTLEQASVSDNCFMFAWNMQTIMCAVVLPRRSNCTRCSCVLLTSSWQQLISTRKCLTLPNLAQAMQCVHVGMVPACQKPCTSLADASARAAGSPHGRRVDFGHH